jgi:hypothetical protein
MATLYQIPTNSNGNSSFSETVSIDGVYYIFLFTWNTRDECWVMSIFDINNNPIICGTKLVIEYELIQMHALANMPSGEMFFLDLSGTDTPCGFNDLGVRCLLFYNSHN